MKRNPQLSFLTIIGSIVLLSSCDKDESLATREVCDNGYFYYSGDEKTQLNQSLTEIWIVFDQDEVSKELAESILGKYSFLEVNLLSNDYKQVKTRINENATDCAVVQEYLKELNNDKQIFSASPVFYLSENDPNSYFILLSEVLTKNNDNVISESDLINYAETFGLELIEAKYSSQYFKVKEVITGFESLEISNQIYESGKVTYSHPNFIAKIELH